MDFLDFRATRPRNTMLELASLLVQDDGFVQFSPDFWDLEVRRSKMPRKVVLKRLTEPPKRVMWTRFGVPDDATRIVVLAYDSPTTLEHVFVWSFLREAGVGIYHERIGWVAPPNTSGGSTWNDLNYRTLSDYVQDEDGTWNKTCRKCGEIKPLENFYLRPSGQRGSKDPYRNQCKECMRGA